MVIAPGHDVLLQYSSSTKILGVSELIEIQGGNTVERKAQHEAGRNTKMRGNKCTSRTHIPQPLQCDRTGCPSNSAVHIVPTPDLQPLEHLHETNRAPRGMYIQGWTYLQQPTNAVTRTTIAFRRDQRTAFKRRDGADTTTAPCQI